MGEIFTGVKNEILTRLAAVLAAGVVVVAAADLALVQPADFAAQLAAKGPRPAVFMVGPNVLYRSKHIPGSVFAGPGRDEAGLAILKAEAGELPHDKEIVVYCGCCPYEMCPNVRPALETLRQMGFTRVKALMIPTNFATDWVDHGYPVELGEAAGK